MWIFNKFRKLKREEVVSAIIDLEREEQLEEEKIFGYAKQVEELVAQSKAEKNREVRVFYAKKVASLKSDRDESIKRATFLLYNIRLLNKLKNAIDDNNFVAQVGKIPMNKLLANQKSLAEFLNRALNTKVANEDIMTEADDTFNEVASMYDENEKIYGLSKEEDDFLAMLEIEESLSDQEDMEIPEVDKKLKLEE